MFDSVDSVIDVINKCVEMNIKFPSDHNKQHDIAGGFRRRLPKADTSCCVGCINGIVIWTRKPTKEGCTAAAGVDKSIFVVGGCKHKFGLNLQIVCNHTK
jgi:hypothetical protein